MQLFLPGVVALSLFCRTHRFRSDVHLRWLECPCAGFALYPAPLSRFDWLKIVPSTFTKDRLVGCGFRVQGHKAPSADNLYVNGLSSPKP